MKHKAMSNSQILNHLFRGEVINLSRLYLISDFPIKWAKSCHQSDCKGIEAVLENSFLKRCRQWNFVHYMLIVLSAVLNVVESLAFFC